MKAVFGQMGGVGSFLLPTFARSIVSKANFLNLSLRSIAVSLAPAKLCRQLPATQSLV
jgi:hypothetical protein